MTKNLKNKENEIVERFFYAQTVGGQRIFAGKAVFAENGKDVVLKIGKETYYGYKPKSINQGKEGA